MIPIDKTVKMSNRRAFTIPSNWRNKINLTQGNIVKIQIKDNSILINACNQYTTEITSTIGEGGQIYIPIEVRNYFQSIGVEQFQVFIDEVNKYIVLKPLA